jgi:hypothetical protein
VSATILVRQGPIIDRSGRPGIIGDVAMDSDRIVALGQSSTADAAKVIDASVSPWRQALSKLTVTPITPIILIGIKPGDDGAFRLIRATAGYKRSALHL